MRRVLYEYKITGVKTNISYLRKIMDVPDFVEGHYDTGFLEKNANVLAADKTYEASKSEAENIAIMASYMDYIVNLEENKPNTADNRPISRWREFGKRTMIRI
jgi:acetyl-CoA carboxylase biotin carboxylase subunit